MPIDPKDVAEIVRQGNNTLISFNVVLVQLASMGVSFAGVDVTAVVKETPALLAAVKDLVGSLKCP